MSAYDDEPTAYDDEPTMNETPERPKRNERLEREVEEILRKSRARPVSFTDEVRRRANATRQASRSRRSGGGDALRRLRIPSSAAFLGIAFVAAIVAAWLSGHSALLANVAAMICLAAIVIPIILQFTRPSGPTNTMWRGRSVAPMTKPGPLEKLVERFRKPRI